MLEGLLIHQTFDIGFWCGNEEAIGQILGSYWCDKEANSDPQTNKKYKKIKTKSFFFQYFFLMLLSENKIKMSFFQMQAGLNLPHDFDFENLPKGQNPPPPPSSQ